MRDICAATFSPLAMAATGVISTVRWGAAARPARGKTAARSSATVSIGIFISIISRKDH